jgi:hypothetical protein
VTDPRDLLRNARPLELPVEICLDGQAVAEHHEARRAWERANEAPRERLTDGSEAPRLADRLRGLEARLRAATVSVRVRALGKDGWNELIARHPMRAGDETDEKLGYNGDTFFDELVPLSMVSMAPVDQVEDPSAWVDLTDEDRALLVKAMGREKFDEVAGTALSVNIRKVSIPFSSAASTPTPSSGRE